MTDSRDDKLEAPKRWRVKAAGDDLITYWKSKPPHSNEYAAAEIIEELEGELTEAKAIAERQMNDAEQARLELAELRARCAGSAEQRSQAEIEALVEEAYTAEAQGWNIKDGIRAVLRRELMRSHEGATDLQEAINKTIVDIAELPDRTSPDDWPEAMLVTADELGRILRENFEQPCAPSATPSRDALPSCDAPGNVTYTLKLSEGKWYCHGCGASELEPRCKYRKSVFPSESRIKEKP